MAARVPYLNREDLAEADREIFDNLAAERGGTVGNIFRALAIVTVGRLTDAQYEFVHHWNLARRVGVTREQLEALADFEKSPHFSDHERAVIRYAVEATNNVKVTDATWNELKSFLETRLIMELVQNVAFYNMVVRVLVPVGVELEPGTTKN